MWWYGGERERSSALMASESGKVLVSSLVVGQGSRGVGVLAVTVGESAAELWCGSGMVGMWSWTFSCSMSAVEESVGMISVETWMLGVLGEGVEDSEGVRRGGGDSEVAATERSRVWIWRLSTSPSLVGREIFSMLESAGSCGGGGWVEGSWRESTDVVVRSSRKLDTMADFSVCFVQLAR